MQLLVLWKESLKVFEKKNLEQMVLVTLKTILTSARMIYLFMLAAFVVKTALLIGFGFIFAHEVIPWTLMTANLAAILVFTYLTLRSSVGRKSWNYYVSYWLQALKLFLTLVILIGFLRYITGSYYWWAFLGPIITWASFFLLDMGNRNCHVGPRCSCIGYAFFRALKMALYNLPIYLVLVACSLVVWAINFFVAYMFNWTSGISIMLLLPIEAALYSNFYIKFLHEQFDVYFSSSLRKEV